MLNACARDRRFAAAAIASLALSVGANAAIFTLVDRVWFRTAPVSDPEQLVVPYRPVGSSSDAELSDEVTGDARLALRELEFFESIASALGAGDAAALWQPRLSFGASEAPLRVAAVSDNYLRTLGVRVRGRDFQPGDDVPSGTALAVISEALWRARFAARPDLVGETVPTTKGPLIVVGIIDGTFAGPRLGDRIDVWIPYGTLPLFSEMAATVPMRLMPATVFARLRDGVTLEEAQAGARSILGQRATLRSLRGLSYRLPSDAARRRQDLLLALLSMAGASMLLLGSANLTALMMARSETRRHEFAVRLSVGATRARLAVRVAAEAGLLCAGGLAAGLLLRSWLLASLSGLHLPAGIAIETIDSAADLRLLAFGGGVAVLACAVASAGSVRAAWRADLAPLLSETGHPARRSWRARNSLLAAHVATCVTLLACAAALNLAVVRAFRADLGVSRDHLLFLNVRPAPSRYPDTRSFTTRAADYAAVLERIRSTPGVEAAACGAPFLTPFPSAPIGIASDGQVRYVPLSLMGGGPNYLTSGGVRFREGRDFVPADERRMVSPRDLGLARIKAIVSGKPYRPPSHTPAAVVDATFASAVWPGTSALGRRFTVEHTGVEYEVVGVVEPVRSGTVGPDVPTMYDFRSFASDDVIADLSLVIRAGDPEGVRPAILSLTRDAFPDAVRLDLRTAGDLSVLERGEEILGARIFGWFGVASALLGAVGIYGLVAQSVSQRTRELGIRSALGASARRLRVFAAARALSPVAIGLAAGSASFWWASYALGATIAGLERPGLEAFGIAAVLLAASAAAAALAGARGVGRINPADLLRAE